jgi:hypothetical protein
MIQIGETFYYENLKFVVSEETGNIDACDGCFFNNSIDYDCNDVMSEEIQCYKKRTNGVIFTLCERFKFGK